MNTTNVTSATAYADRSVAGYNPELADFSNPEGAYYVNVARVSATTASGRRFVLAHEFASLEAARRTAERVAAYGRINLDLWAEIFPVYGSEDWHEEEAERRLSLGLAIRNGDRDAIERLA